MLSKLLFTITYFIINDLLANLAKFNECLLRPCTKLDDMMYFKPTF